MTNLHLDYLLFGGAHAPNYAVCRHRGVGHSPRQHSAPTLECSRHRAKLVRFNSHLAPFLLKGKKRKKPTPNLWFDLGFFWLRRWDLKGPLENIVASGACAWRASDAPYFLPCRPPSPSHRERSYSKPTSSPSLCDGGGRDDSNPSPEACKKKNHPNGWFSFWLRRWDLNLTTSGL